MSTAKVAVSMDAEVLKRLDHLVRRGVFANRSRGVEEAVAEKLDRLDRRRLAQQCAKLDPDFEQSMAEEGMSLAAAEWPEY